MFGKCLRLFFARPVSEQNILKLFIFLNVGVYMCIICFQKEKFKLYYSYQLVDLQLCNRNNITHFPNQI